MQIFHIEKVHLYINHHFSFMKLESGVQLFMNRTSLRNIQVRPVLFSHLGSGLPLAFDTSVVLMLRSIELFKALREKKVVDA